ncbi:tyrosine phosphatase family-domain-containing protein [Phaeosphaeria sp. MPI-PUGE-AT-0046c]|nr:tyrosine phosphatase family-domain-containing protein [Phaeosphaeria sp. MPI-PUGE-AT-0046c]
MSSPQALPSPPFHNIPNIANLRDAALFPLQTATGPLKPSLLFRSADVSKLLPENWSSLSALGVTHVFDLRSAPEVGFTSSTPSTSLPTWVSSMNEAGINRTWVPVFAEQDYSPEGLAKRYVKYMDESVTGFVSAYHDILLAAGPAYRSILLYLIRSPGAGVLVHCTAGKDRTGIFFGIVFDYLGVDRQAIADEYNLTEQGLGSVREEVVARLMKSPAFRNYMNTKQTGEQLSTEEIGRLIQEEKEGKAPAAEEELDPETREVGRQAALRMVGARKETMIAALQMVDKVFGGSEKYLREYCGLGDKDLEALRRNLVDGA